MVLNRPPNETFKPLNLFLKQKKALKKALILKEISILRFRTITSMKKVRPNSISSTSVVLLQQLTNMQGTQKTASATTDLFVINNLLENDS